MIDYFALALGHGLIAIALLRLVLREGLDADPLIGAIQSETADHRKATTTAGRNAARRVRSADEVEHSDPDEPGVQTPQRSRTNRAKAAHR
ncbi:MAG: hypothetical protein NWP98_02945 [Erythrobacter sp.]|nr:hypothetical protein [Erythrobacter sp.]